jgi:hypothetical protein
MKLLITDLQHNTLQPFKSLFFLFSFFFALSFTLVFALSFTLFFDFLLTANTKQSMMVQIKIKQEYGGRTKAVTSNVMNGMNTK